MLPSPVLPLREQFFKTCQPWKRYKVMRGGGLGGIKNQKVNRPKDEQRGYLKSAAWTILNVTKWHHWWLYISLDFPLKSVHLKFIFIVFCILIKDKPHLVGCCGPLESMPQRGEKPEENVSYSWHPLQLSFPFLLHIQIGTNLCSGGKAAWSWLQQILVG